MKRKRVIALSTCAVGVILGGCATVQPRMDYARVAERVTEATGVSNVYRPDEDEQSLALVNERLADDLSVDDAVTIALLNNPTLQASFFRVGMARADAVQAGLLSNPSLGVSLRLPAGGGLSNVEANLAQNIAELWQIPLRKQAAERSINAAILNVARQAAVLATDTKRAYFAAVQAKELHDVVQENLNVATRLSQLAIERRDAGASTQIEVNLARTAVIEAELQAETTQLAADNALRELATLLGLSNRASELQLADALPDVPDKPLSEDALMRMAKASRLDVAAARQLVNAAEARLRTEHRKVFKSVKLGVSLEREARKSQGSRDVLTDTARASVANGGLTAPEIQPRSERDTDTGFVIGPSLSLELPIFDQNQAQIANARFAYQQAKKSLDALERRLVQQVHGALDRVETNWRLVRMYRDRSLPLAEENLELSQEAYRLGRASFLSVLEAQRFLLSSRRDYVTALGQAARTLPEMEQVVGLPLADFVAETNSGDGS